MIEQKVQDILDSADYIRLVFAAKYTKGLVNYGNGNVMAGTYFDMLVFALSKDYIGGNLQLELYKKTRGLIDSMNIVPITGGIAPPQPILNATVFYGSTDPGLTGDALKSELASEFVGITDMEMVFSPTHEVYYFAYPSSFPPVSNILDQNNFVTLPGWKSFVTTFTIEGLPVEHRVYEFKNFTTQTDFVNKFKFD